MSTISLYTPEQVINITEMTSVVDDEFNDLNEVVELFKEGVAELRSLIETANCILHCPVSQGKDSTIVELMALEAYRQSISENRIEASRPLILSTVDTGGEAIPMRMYVAYAKRRLVRYAKKLGINVIYDIVRPPLNDEYFVKFTGGHSLYLMLHAMVIVPLF